MKVNFHKKPVVDFVVRLLLTIIIISPVLYFSWDAVKGTSGGDYIESVVFILVVGFFCVLFASFYCLSGSNQVIQKVKVGK